MARIATRLVSGGVAPPAHTVTICLPSFLAGGEGGERAFSPQPAHDYGSTAGDKLQRRGAPRRTAAKPAASFIVSEFSDYRGFEPPTHRARQAGWRREAEAGTPLAEQIAGEVDVLVDAQRSGSLISVMAAQEAGGASAPPARARAGAAARGMALAAGVVQVTALGRRSGAVCARGGPPMARRRRCWR